MEVPLIITILVTMASPYVNAYINKVTWSPEKKNLVALAVSTVIAVAYLFFTGGIADWSQLGVVIPAIYGLQTATYQFLLKVPASKFEAATRTDSVILTPIEDELVEVTTTESIKANDHIQIDAPVHITAKDDPQQPITALQTENPVKG